MAEQPDFFLRVPTFTFPPSMFAPTHTHSTWCVRLEWDWTVQLSLSRNTPFCYMISMTRSFLLCTIPHKSVEMEITEFLWFCVTHTQTMPGCIFVHAIFLSKKGNVHLFSRSHSHTLTNATRCHEYFRGLCRLLPVPGVLVSFLELRFHGKMALLALGGRPQPLSKSPLKVKRDIFTRKWMR